MSPAGRAILSRVSLLVVLVGGAVLRLVGVTRPFDHRSLASWREADYLGIARNFEREGLDPLHPRVDWRADTPGYAEMEFPFAPWLAGALGRVSGGADAWLRWICAAASIAALLAFARLARASLDATAAVAAVLAFALAPLATCLATSAQPENFMLTFSILAVGRLWKFEDHGRSSDLLLAALLLAAAMLSKAPAACLALLFADVAFRRYGLRACIRSDVCAAAVVALAPTIAWYAWVHHFWIEYGLSLGLSNETHWISRVMLSNLEWLRAEVDVERHLVFTGPGALLVAAALLLRAKGIVRPLRWAIACAIFYFAAADTAGDEWAFYYHDLSIAPVALLVGAGLGALVDFARCQPTASWRARGTFAAALGLAAMTAINEWRAGRRLEERRDHDPVAQRSWEAVPALRSTLPAGARIAVRGGALQDAHGHPVAHNQSTWFAWLDRRGFNYANEELSLDKLESLAARGATHWIAEQDELADPTFRNAVNSRFPEILDSGWIRLFELRAR